MSLNGLQELEKDWLSLPLWIRDLMQSTWRLIK